ncbi:hypothetical protein [Pseudomonas mediterranea]|uniref:hypothetical protein n=1 Tax=Pseudomonas mediterranea TaxID=183795 RepID=UPI001DCE46AD|nr:hypothetical protein [Pseudomonas mediterranea]CAH0157180.1 hypothetical protein SRABI112_00836 [Pseudomonas mediterranea]
MLKPISQPLCCGALSACLELQMHLLRWLCDPTTADADVTQINLTPPLVATQIEADWLWRFLYGRKQTRLNQAKLIAGMLPSEKSALLAWSNSVVAVADQFHAVHSAWPTVLPAISTAAWAAFKNLMAAFYERGLQSGLPYKPDGTPVATGGVCYADYVKAFRDAHRLNPDPNAREVCVLCGGPLGLTPEVDHWIAKSAYPLLSVCAENLLPICGECNSTANKGEKDVHSAGSFADWFHPYLRPGNGAVQLDYVLPEFSVRCSATTPADQPKAAKLDALLNLSSRWTKEFKAEYANRQDVLRRRERQRIQQAQGRHTQFEIQAYVQQWQMDLAASEPHHEVYRALAAALQEPTRLAAWHSELALVT